MQIITAVDTFLSMLNKHGLSFPQISLLLAVMCFLLLLIAEIRLMMMVLKSIQKDLNVRIDGVSKHIQRLIFLMRRNNKSRDTLSAALVDIAENLKQE